MSKRSVLSSYTVQGVGCSFAALLLSMMACAPADDGVPLGSGGSSAGTGQAMAGTNPGTAGSSAGMTTGGTGTAMAGMPGTSGSSNPTAGNNQGGSSHVYTNPWIVENRHLGHVEILDLKGTVLAWPPTNMVLVAERSVG